MSMLASPSPFAAVMQQVNDATERALANTTATFGGGESFPVVFDRALANPLGLVEAASLHAAFHLRHAPGLQQGGVLVIDGTSYSVVGDLEPDASGWVEVRLREA